MNKEEWDLKKLVIDKIRFFGKVHPIRKKLFERNQDKSETVDREKLIGIRYLSQDRKTNFYGILSESDCHCGCGAGHLNLAVMSLEQPRDISKVAEEIEIYMNNRYNGYGRGSEFAENIIFEILTGRAGNRRQGSWNSIYEISGLQIPYDTCISLIKDLTKNTRGRNDKKSK